jgi:hypothetical protein
MRKYPRTMNRTTNTAAPAIQATVLTADELAYVKGGEEKPPAPIYPSDPPIIRG